MTVYRVAVLKTSWALVAAESAKEALEIVENAITDSVQGPNGFVTEIEENATSWVTDFADKEP